MDVQSNKLLSIVIPAYNEEAMIDKIFKAIKIVMEEAMIPFEIIFVDDGSRDATYRNIEALSEKYSEVKGLSFSRNFGKESAIFAGLEVTRGGVRLCY